MRLRNYVCDIESVKKVRRSIERTIMHLLNVSIFKSVVLALTTLRWTTCASCSHPIQPIPHRPSQDVNTCRYMQYTIRK